VERAGAGGAVWAGGVAGVGGAWALATPDAAMIAQERKSECLIRIPINGLRGWKFLSDIPQSHDLR
jgi:hypothetical protein